MRYLLKSAVLKHVSGQRVTATRHSKSIGFFLQAVDPPGQKNIQPTQSVIEPNVLIPTVVSSNSIKQKK